MKHILIIAAMFCACIAGFGQNETMTNKKVIDLAKAKIDEPLIIGMIKANKANFNTSTDSIIYLAQNGVSQAVIKEMMNKNTVVYAQPDPATTAAPAIVAAPVETKEDRIKKAMENIRTKVDDMTNKVTYFSNKTPKDPTDEDRMFIYVYKDGAKPPLLGWIFYHNPLPNNMNDYMAIQTIMIKGGDETRQFLMTENNYYGGGTRHSYYKNFIHKEAAESVVPFLRKAASSETKIRFEGGGHFKDWELSGREKKAINEVLDLYIAMPKD